MKISFMLLVKVFEFLKFKKIFTVKNKIYFELYKLFLFLFFENTRET